MLIDSSAWIAFYRNKSQLMLDDGTPDIVALRTQLRVDHLLTNKQRIQTTPAIIQEMLQGCRTEKEYAGVYEQLIEDSHLHKLSNQPQAAIDAAEIYRNCRADGRRINKPYDCLIALIAMRDNLTILHRDKDFINIGVVYPSLQHVHFFDAG